jgi:hypothetical protein
LFLQNAHSIPSVRILSLMLLILIGLLLTAAVLSLTTAKDGLYYS